MHGIPGDWGALFDFLVTQIPRTIRDFDAAARLLAASRDLVVEWASHRTLDQLWALIAASASGVIAARWKQISGAWSRIGRRARDTAPLPPDPRRRRSSRSDHPKLPF